MESENKLIPLKERHLIRDEVTGAILEGAQLGGLGTVLVGFSKGSQETAFLGGVTLFSAQIIYLSPVLKAVASDIKNRITSRGK